MNQSGWATMGELTVSELRRALDDALAETAELHRELAGLRLRLVLQAREMEALRQARIEAQTRPETQAAEALRSTREPEAPPATFGRRVKDRLLRSPLRHPLLPVWRLYVESGMRDAVNRVRGAVSNSLRRR